MPLLTVAFKVVSNALPGETEKVSRAHGRVVGLDLRILCLGVLLSGMNASSPGYMDVTDRFLEQHSAIAAAAADGEVCPPGAVCPTTAAGWALRFDGIADCARALCPVSKDFTIEAWVQLEATGSGALWWEGLPLFWADLNAQADDFSTTLLNGSFRFVTGSPNGDAIISSRTTIPTSQWVHLAATRTMSTGLMTIFVNGHADASSTGPTGALTGQAEFWVFCSNTNLFTPGTIDEQRAWDVARSEADIQATMHRRVADDEPGLVGYWRFDDGAGTTATDSSPTGNSLVLGGSGAETVPTWVPSTAPIEGP
jgi:hypothetical protein